MRFKIVNFIIAFFFIFLSLGILNLEIIQGVKFKELSDKNCMRLLPQVGARGRILDREGNVLVDNYLSCDLKILPQQGKELNSTLMKIAYFLNSDLETLKGRFRNNYVSPSIPVTIAENIDLKKIIALEELKTDFPSIIIYQHPVRHYPYGRLACHVIGYLSEIDHWRLTKLSDYGYKTKDVVGYTGIEEKYDYYLRQEEGAQSVEVDHRGKFMRMVAFKPPRNGKDIQLTLDIRVQKIVEENLGDKKGCVVIMDPFTGEIIAMASRPDFDPNLFIDSPAGKLADIFNDSSAPLINRAISSVYPPGSIFKLIVASAALEMNKINEQTSFLCTGSIYVGNQEFSCWGLHHQQDLVSAIAHSCNVFFYNVGLLIGAQAIHDYSLKFGLSKLTAIDLPYEEEGIVPCPLWKRVYKLKNWFDGDTVNFSIGQGYLLVSPLQLVRAMSLFANKKMLVTPYLVKSVDGKDISAYQRKFTYIGIKDRTIDYIRRGARGVVFDPKGTASNLSGLKVEVAGKTGTAQVAGSQPHGWFVGFFPFKTPRFVICSFLENGGAGYNASVLTKKIIEEMIEEGII